MRISFVNYQLNPPLIGGADENGDTNGETQVLCDVKEQPAFETLLSEHHCRL